LGILLTGKHQRATEGKRYYPKENSTKEAYIAIVDCPGGRLIFAII
jgi:hypothetical protein